MSADVRQAKMRSPPGTNNSGRASTYQILAVLVRTAILAARGRFECGWSNNEIHIYLLTMNRTIVEATFKMFCQPNLLY